MPRVKGGVTSRSRKKKLFRRVKGFWGRRKNIYRTAREAMHRALRYAYRDRKARKRDFRQLWITRINAAVREHGLSYSVFMNALKNAGVDLNRKVLAEMAVSNPADFKKLTDLAKEKVKVPSKK